MFNPIINLRFGIYFLIVFVSKLKEIIMAAKKNSRLMEMLGETSGRIKIKEERVLNYLLENEDRIQELSISDIAENADVSKATVVRFCKSLDFTGLKDFKVWYEAGKGAKFTPVKLLTGKEDPEEGAKLFKDGANGTLEKTLSGSNISVLSSVVDNIRKSEKITIIGSDGENFYAEELKRVILAKYPNKNVIVNSSEVNPESYSIVISLTGTDKDAMTYLMNAVLAGGKVTAVTSDESSIIGKAASDCLVISDEVLFDADRHLLGRIALNAVISYLSILLSREEQ